MNKDTIVDYLKRAEMEPVQAEALSHILAEMATKADLRVLEVRVTELETRLTGHTSQVETRLTGQMAEHRADTAARLAELESRLTWRMIAIVGFFATVSSLLGMFVE